MQTERTDSGKPGRNTDSSTLEQGSLLRLVGYNCRQAYLHIMPVFMKRMAKYELRPVDYTILTLVNANPDINQKRLAQAINVSPPNLAPLLDRLEHRSLLLRQRNPADKRSQSLALTPEGRRLCVNADQTAFDLECSATNALTDEERGELLRLLQKVFLNGGHPALTNAAILIKDESP
jgi:DNA-binding MarR family transcriptional regulator